jgi:hypothetical protein
MKAARQVPFISAEATGPSQRLRCAEATPVEALNG